MRIRIDNKSPDLTEIDFLFNDVTRTKIIEINNADFLYKTVFLSKVAHEFKNPLICITELIDQIDDKISATAFEDLTDFKKNLARVKTFSNYLLILVKDLDFFSQKQVGNAIILEKTEAEIEEIIKFCSEVGECLIKKFDKKEQIKLSFLNSPSSPKLIRTDEGRLKQVLVNLISNSIKFTQIGDVELEISSEIINEINFVKFCVKDTGIGIKKEIKEKLFTPFNKGTNNLNQIGAGLGLSIVRDLTEKLGSKIEF